MEISFQLNVVRDTSNSYPDDTIEIKTLTTSDKVTFILPDNREVQVAKDDLKWVLQSL